MFDGGHYQGLAGSVQGAGGFGADVQSQGTAMPPGAQQQTQQTHLGMNPAQFAAMSQMGPDLSAAAGHGLTPAMLAMLQQQTQQQGGASGSRWPGGQSFNPSMFNQPAQQAPSSQPGAPSYASYPAYNFGAMQGSGNLGGETGAGLMFGQQNAGMPYAQFGGASVMPQTGGVIEPSALMNGMNGFAEPAEGPGSSYGSMQPPGSSANGGMQPFMYASASSPGASDVGEFKKPGTSQGGRRSRGTPTSTPGPKFGPPGAQQGSSPGHAVPHAGGIQAFARDRSRSHTRSPSVSGAQLPQQSGHRPPGTPLQSQQLYPGAVGTPHGAHAPQPHTPLPSFPPGWQPSMPPAQQQQMMSQAMQLSKQRASQGQAMSPSQALQQMGFVFVKAALLPPQTQEALVAGGAVISINEARALGFLPQQVQTHAGQGTGPVQTPAAQSPHPSTLNLQAQQQQFLMQQQQQQQQQHARTQTQQAQQQQIPPHAPSTPQQQSGMAPPQVFRPSPGAHAASPAHGPQSPSANGGGTPAPNGSAAIRARQTTGPARPQSQSSARGGSRPPMTDELAGANPFSSAPGSDVLESGPRRPSSALPLDSAPPGPSRSFSAASADGMSGGAPDALATIEQQAQAQAAQLRAHRFSVASLPPSQGGPLPKFTKSGFAVADYNSRVTPLPPLPDGDEVPEEDAKALEKLWQPLTKEEEAHLAVIMQRDHDYTQMINTHGRRSLNALQARAEELRPAPQNLHWWERPDVADDTHYINKAYEALHVLLPQQKRHEQQRKGGRSAGTLASNLSAYEDRRLSRAAAGKVEDLVPIRLEIDFEAWKLRETFTWNASDAHVGLDSFAQTLCEDFGLPPAGFVAAIKQAVQTQVQDHVAARALYARQEAGSDARGGTLDAEAQQWWKRQRDSLARDASPSPRKRALIAEPEDELAVAKSESSVAVARPRAELRIDIRLDITVGAFNLVDRFEWDLGEPEATSPEQFAEVFAADLGLSGEFRTAIAHSIREQVDVHKRSLALVGYTFDGADVYDEELRTCFLPSVTGAARSEADADSHTPRLHQLSEADIDMLEKERERDARRKRRQTRGRRGINLPDREPQKTQRTPAVSGLQAASIAAMLANNGGEMVGGGEWNALGPGGRSERGAGISTRRAAAAATASIAPTLGAPDRDTPAPAPEAPQAAAKRARLESHAVHFVHPGGLGGLGEASGPSFVGANGGELHKHSTAPAQASAAASTPAQETPQAHMSAKAAAAAALAAKARAEDIATQHACIHDGQWHCSNCGIPGTLAPGRRKGPLGDKTLCGPCGKYYHRHRRIQNVHYTRDEGFHRGLYGQSKIPRPEHGDSTQPTSAADTPISGANDSSGTRADKRRADREARREAGDTQQSSSDDDDDDDDEEEEEEDNEAVDDKSKIGAAGLDTGPLVSQPQSTRGNSPDLPFQQVGSPDEDSDSESSPGSSRRPSASPSKNGIQPRPSQTPALHAGSPLKQEQGIIQETQRVLSESPALAPPSSQQAPAVAPEWLSEAAASLRQQYPDDRFELLLRARPAAAASAPEVPGQTDWRVRCQDCPGKLYTPGPGESLANFLIHLRNRLHRNNVAARLSHD